MRRLPLVWLLMLMLSAVALAVTDEESPPAEANAADPDYTAGLAAWKNQDWQGVVTHLSKVIERRPWNDDAYNRLGFAYRKLGDYQRSLAHYQTALDLNPHHRGALEYLGEAYLEMDRPAPAAELLKRLEIECQRVAGDGAGDWMKNCEEWQDLKQAIDAYNRAKE